MIVLAMGQKESGKTRLIRQLVAARLTRFPRSSVLVHDPKAQYSGGAEFGSTNELRGYIRQRGAMPRLCLIRADSADAVCVLAKEIKCLTLVLDELDMVCTQKRWKSEAARDIAHYGRHDQIDLFGAFRFTRNVNEDLPALSDFIFVLRHSAAALFDIRILAQRLGDYYAEQAVRLANHEAIVWSDGYTP